MFLYVIGGSSPIVWWRKSQCMLIEFKSYDKTKLYKSTGTVPRVADAFEQGLSQTTQRLVGSTVVPMKLDQRWVYSFPIPGGIHQSSEFINQPSTSHALLVKYSYNQGRNNEL